MSRKVLDRLRIPPAGERTEEWMRKEQERREVVRKHFQKLRAAKGRKKSDA